MKLSVELWPGSRKESMRILFVNGHVWQSEQLREPPASWLLISRPKDDRNAGGMVLALGVGDAPEEHRLAWPASLAPAVSPAPSHLPSLESSLSTYDSITLSTRRFS